MIYTKPNRTELEQDGAELHEYQPKFNSITSHQQTIAYTKGRHHLKKEQEKL